jgi:hypothetical protein
MIINSPVFKDARLRGKYREFLQSKRANRHNVPGQDHNRAGQGVSAMLGKRTDTYTNRPRYTVGQHYQQHYRNRATEQAGPGRPAAPAAPVLAGTPRKY